MESAKERDTGKAEPSAKQKEDAKAKLDTELSALKESIRNATASSLHGLIEKLQDLKSQAAFLDINIESIIKSIEEILDKKVNEIKEAAAPHLAGVPGFENYDWEKEAERAKEVAKVYKDLEKASEEVSKNKENILSFLGSMEGYVEEGKDIPDKFINDTKNEIKKLAAQSKYFNKAETVANEEIKDASEKIENINKYLSAKKVPAEKLEFFNFAKNYEVQRKEKAYTALEEVEKYHKDVGEIRQKIEKGKKAVENCKIKNERNGLVFEEMRKSLDTALKIESKKELEQKQFPPKVITELEKIKSQLKKPVIEGNKEKSSSGPNKLKVSTISR